MSQRVVYFNGNIVPEHQARVSIFDSALMFGDMAFEMTRTFNGVAFRLRDHLERLFGSLRLLEIECGLTIEEMEQVTLETLEANKPTEVPEMDWQIMHNVSRGPLGLYKSALPNEMRPTISINCWPLITHMGSFAANYESGVKLIIPTQQAIPAHLADPKAKTRSRMHYQMAQLQAARNAQGNWPVLLDPDGYLAEGTGWNIFLVSDGELLTPEPRNILQGVSRKVTIELARDAGINVRETNLGRYEALQADEIFCTATTYSLVHASTFEGQTIGDGNSGPVFQQLMRMWKKLATVDFVQQAEMYADGLTAWEDAQN